MNAFIILFKKPHELMAMFILPKFLTRFKNYFKKITTQEYLSNIFPASMSAQYWPIWY